MAVLRLAAYGLLKEICINDNVRSYLAFLTAKVRHGDQTSSHLQAAAGYSVYMTTLIMHAEHANRTMQQACSISIACA